MKFVLFIIANFLLILAGTLIAINNTDNMIVGGFMIGIAFTNFVWTIVMNY